MMWNCCGFLCAQRLRIVIALSLTTLVVLLLSSVRSPAVFRSQLARSRPPDWNGLADLEVEPTGLVVDTRSCRIPDFDAYNPSISPYISDPDPQFIVCNHSLPITFTDGQYIRLNTTLTTSLHIQHCLYQQVRFMYRIRNLLK